MLTAQDNKELTVLHTDGDGLWSRQAGPVRIVSIDLLSVYEDEGKGFGELGVFFNTADWNVKDIGLIYTDELFEKELKEYLTLIGLDAKDVGYSEQGMQGDDYVSLDAGPKFVASFKRLFPKEYASVLYVD